MSDERFMHFGRAELINERHTVRFSDLDNQVTGGCRMAIRLTKRLVSSETRKRFAMMRRSASGGD